MSSTTLIMINVFVLGGATLLVYLLTHSNRNTDKKIKRE